MDKVFQTANIKAANAALKAIKKADQQLKHRQLVERKIVRHLIRTMKKHGWVAGKVWDGEESIVCRTERDAMNVVFSVDESTFSFYNVKLMRTHNVLIVLGNDGNDCICDYGCSNDDDFRTIMESEVDPYSESL
jgi:hypothetical protein